MGTYHEQMHKENTMAFMAIVYSFLGVKTEEEKGANKKPLDGFTLGRELTEDEISRLPSDVREVIRLNKGRVKPHWVEEKK